MPLCYATLLLFALFILRANAANPARPLNLDDLAKLHDVSDPHVSPDGQWVTYTVSSVDREADKKVTHIWMANWAGDQELQVTNGSEGESSPRWSADGRYLSFISSRAGKAKASQVWLIDRRGGEARQLTHLKNYSISGYEWAPNSTKLLLVLREKEEGEGDDAKPPAAPKPPKPVVIDRYHFKQDMEGYLDRKHNHIYSFEIATEKLEPITSGNFDETNPAWSPDGTKIVFVSNQDKDPDRTENTDIFVADAKPNAQPRRLTSYTGPDSGHPVWSPDGQSIAYLQGSEPKYYAYNMTRLAVVSISGGAPRMLTEHLDRGVSAPVFTQDGRNVLFLVADDRSEYPAQVPVSGGATERLLGEAAVASSLASHAGHSALLLSTDRKPAEIFAMDGGSLRPLSHQNDALVAEIKLGSVEDISFKSADGTEVHGLLTKPADFEAGRKYPTLLRIHGGPNGQDGMPSASSTSSSRPTATSFLPSTIAAAPVVATSMAKAFSATGATKRLQTCSPASIIS